jgi:hypothetical protein
MMNYKLSCEWTSNKNSLALDLAERKKTFPGCYCFPKSH